ncbi:hypothetical protein I6E17_04905 [Fusobacterium perfoetens]|uniref:hypothetical protein n=1 Tax=Fusobacterium perfoetens TaxID=852 RepID=UPI001F35B4DD|nr:hypothetical protein [Fusobacterium perfoetens]MCF2625520.1 hypothetical protein [Fusobacterium perfoetens]
MNEKIETPYFLIDKEKLEKNFEDMYVAFKNKWKNLIIGYSVKTNSLPWIINYFKEKGAYAEVVSKDEFELAKALGFSLNNIIYNGPIKSEKTFIEALEGNSILNIDSFTEIEWLKKNKPKNQRMWEIGIRINFDLESMCPGETVMGQMGGRFGFNYENGEFFNAIKELEKLEYIKISGLHLHNSTKTRSLNVYKDISEMAIKIKEEFKNLNFKYIDVGGGFFGGLKDKPQFLEYAKVITEILEKKYSKDTTLIIEPGASLVASPISFISKVISIKNVKENRILTINGSCNNINPLMRDKKFNIKFKNDLTARNIIKNQIIAGYTCMENDILLCLKNEKELFLNDEIEFLNMGSYTMTLSPLFIEYFPKVIVKDKDKYSIARERWAVKEFLQKNYL